MKTDLEKIRELRIQWTHSKHCGCCHDVTQRLVKEIKENAEKGCGKRLKRKHGDLVKYFCSSIHYCDNCKEIIKICKEIEG